MKSNIIRYTANLVSRASLPFLMLSAAPLLTQAQTSGRTATAAAASSARLGISELSHA